MTLSLCASLSASCNSVRVSEMSVKYVFRRAIEAQAMMKRRCPSGGTWPRERTPKKSKLPLRERRACK
ncbi:MAG: hypothetical protein J5761_02655 [Paludibacteraceae bacterium]|nr:hypothetical protein [Paludibacteraceae bacterium]